MDDYAPPPYWKTAQSGLRPHLALNHGIKEQKQNYIAHNIFQNTYMCTYNYIASVYCTRLVMVNSACASCMPS